MSNLINFNVIRALDLDGVPVSGAQAFFYDSGTDQPRTVYADIGATVPHPQPVIADGDGVFPAAYAEGGTPVRVVVRDADGAMVAGYPVDPVMMTPAGDAQASAISFNPTGSIPALNVQQAIEMVQASNVEPLNDVGWGVTGNAGLIVDIDAINTPSGVYRFDGTTLGSFPEGVTKAWSGIVRVERRSAAYVLQTLQAGTEAVPYSRVLDQSLGGWQPWFRFLDASTHNQATWNAGLNAVPKAVSPLALRGAALSLPIATREAKGLMDAWQVNQLTFGTAPIGAIFMFAGTTAPDGWAFCRGQVFSRTNDSALFAVIGTTYGAGNGTTTFNLPNFSGRSPVGAGAGGVYGVSQRWLGQMDGTETVALTEAQMPRHNHWFSRLTSWAGRHRHRIPNVEIINGGSTFRGRWSEGVGEMWTDEVGDHQHLVEGDTDARGGGEAHNNMHPFIGINFIIRVR
ncbi:hypothetical protein BVG79_01097 [Ketogulonicigenium robustum]|uniref:Phage tail collar domain-containing protein n=1 Tax=Ketogulonicigenium robustum TaxID=92947 RepID=A0A1W6NZ62_9RHOB|nr:tail fiber protein [Ketogulonicigenium robustum]ARO14443.1 hypothetical protein BVG79_01097 [Ketogulonicigenium robustum]